MKKKKASKPERREISLKRLRQAGREVGLQARMENFAMGLPITVLEGNSIVEIFSDGRKRVVEKLELKRRPVKQRVFKAK